MQQTTRRQRIADTVVGSADGDLEVRRYLADRRARLATADAVVHELFDLPSPLTLQWRAGQKPPNGSEATVVMEDILALDVGDSKGTSPRPVGRSQRVL